MDAREVKANGFSKALKEASKNFATRTRPTKRMRFSAFMGQSFPSRPRFLSLWLNNQRRKDKLLCHSLSMFAK